MQELIHVYFHRSLTITDDMVADPIVNTFFLAKVKEAGGYRSSTDGDGVLHLYHLSGISQVGVNYFPHQKLPVEFDATGPPLWSSYNFLAPSTLNDILRGKDIYCLSCICKFTFHFSYCDLELS